MLAFSLYFAYQFVGVFGAGSAVDALENRFFGGVQAEVASLVPSPAAAPEGAAPGTIVLAVERSPDGSTTVRAHAVNAAGDALEPAPETPIDVYPTADHRSPIAGVGGGHPTSIHISEANRPVGLSRRWLNSAGSRTVHRGSISIAVTPAPWS